MFELYLFEGYDELNREKWVIESSFDTYDEAKARFDEIEDDDHNRALIRYKLTWGEEK